VIQFRHKKLTRSVPDRAAFLMFSPWL
jgi:hypothetical protein